jgi:hypothetical protein
VITRQMITRLIGSVVLFTVLLGPLGVATEANIVPVARAVPIEQAGGAFAVGSRLWVAGTGGAGLNLRSAPRLSSDVVGALDEGDLVQVLEGPVLADGIHWYRVDSITGDDLGWADGRFLSATAPGAQTPTPIGQAPGGSTPLATATGGLATPSPPGTAAPLTGTPGTGAGSLQPQNLPLTATLIGGAEVPGPGDPDAVGSAAVTVDPTAGLVCYTVHVAGIGTPATAAHIHEGAVGEAGPVVVPFTAPTGGNSSGCAQSVERAVVTRLMQNPAGFYVNVHNADYPDGAARGQLGR